MTILSQLTTILEISRPRFWMYLAGPVLIGTVLGASSLSDLSNPVVMFLLIISTLPLNLFLYGVNDLYDAETDQHNPKKQMQEHHLHRRHYTMLIKWSTGVTAIVGILSLVLLPNTASKLLLVLFMFLSWGYSANPLRFKSKEFLDSWSNVLYIIPGLIAYSVFSAPLPNFQVIVGLAAWTAGMHLYSAIPDISADARAGVRTTAVVLGTRRSLLLTACYWLSCALILISEFPAQHWLVVLSVYPIIPIAHLLFPSIDLQKMYWYFPWLNTILGFATFWILAIQRLL